MEKWFVKIIYTFFVLSVGFAFIGVNVSRAYCGHCEKAYVQVRMIPQERECGCDGRCGCAEERKRGDEIPDAHVFYKVNGFPVAEQGGKGDTVLYVLMKERIFGIEIYKGVEKEDGPEVRIGAERPPEQEELCIYRC